MSDSPDQPMSSNASDEVETENSSVDEPEGENPVNGSGQVSNGSMGDS